MNHGSLFSGIGGFDLAAEWMGWENIFHCEINPFGKKVLKYYWPKAISYDDITKTDFTFHRGNIDILTGGFPCQPFSVAGKRKGTEDSRNLWPEYHRAIREIQPTWVVGENVPGLINWSKGLVFEQVQADLEAEGYEVWPFVLPACSVGAPHKRERVWFVANANLPGCKQSHKKMEGGKAEQFNGVCFQQANSNTGNKRLQRGQYFGSITKEGEKSFDKQFIRPLCGFDKEYTFESPVCIGDNGISDRLDGITFSKWRNESIKAAGNAVVPQIPYQIFKAIEQFETLITPK